MMTFTFEGTEYTFDALACYATDGYIQLPDGRVLSVLGWYESYPPKPLGLSVVKTTPAYTKVGA